MGSMNKPLFDIDRAGMQFEINSYKPGTGFAWSQLFPIKYTSRFDLKGIEGKDGIPVSADKVAFNSKAPKKGRKTVGSWSGQLSKIAISKEKNEMEINEYRDLQVIAANSDDPAQARELVDLVYDDIKACNDGMDARVELDAMRIACTGKQVYSSKIDGDMVTDDVIDFNVPKENFGGAAKPWATYSAGKWTVDATADGIKDIADAMREIQKKGLKKPQFVFMEQMAFDWLISQTATQKRMYPAAYQAGTLTSDMITIDGLNSYMRSKGYPQVRVLDTFVSIEHKDGSQEVVKPWSEHLITMSPVEQLGYTYYKPVPMIDNTDALQVQGSYYKTTRYSELNPMLEVTMSEAYVQPALTNRASLVFLNVAKTTWNNGDK